MGNQKQQVISRFFAPKPNQPSVSSSSAPASASSQSVPSPSLTHPPTPPPKICTTVDFSPSKRARMSRHLSPSSSSPKSKKPKLAPHTQNPIRSLPPPCSSPTLHQKFLQKLLDPPDHLLSTSEKNPSTLPVSNPPTGKPTATTTSKYTPLEQQVVNLKAKYPDVILMIEVGYKYRFFGEDAEIAARVLGIYAHVDHNFQTASIPTFRLNIHVRRLVAEGYKVGVVKQTETASIKAHGANRVGPFSRDLSALYTKATIEAAEDLGGVGGEESCEALNNYLFCVVESGVLVETVDRGSASGVDVKIGVVAVEISTGDVIYGEFSDNVMRSMLEAVILSLSPVELLLGEPLSKQTNKLLSTYAGSVSNIRVEHASKDGSAFAELIFAAENNSELRDETKDLLVKKITDMPDLAIQAMALILQHLKQFGLDRILYLGASFRPISSSMEMSLSANTLQQLEVLRNNSDGSKSGSLLQHMNHTLTTFGSRLLRHWVTHPLCDGNMIMARLDAVAEISESMGGHMSSDGVERKGSDLRVCHPEVHCVLSSVLTNLRRCPDIQRGIMRIFHQTVTPTEFIAVVRAILFAGKQLQQLCTEGIDDSKEVDVNIRSALLCKLIQTACSSSLISNAVKLLSYLNTEAAEKGDRLNLINASDVKFPEVAHSRTKVHSANEKLESLIDLYRKQLGMRNLKFMSVSGLTHLLEFPSEARVPSEWVKASSTKKTTRYHTPEVLAGLAQLSLANEELAIVCRTAWTKFLGEFTEHYSEFKAAVQALAALDCLFSLSIISRNENYVRPVFVDDMEPVQIQIMSGRHPVLETMLQDNFVPNDTNLHAEKEYCQIVTGPNMGGKSCYIRQVALITIMAQVGSFVPASFARLHVVDTIQTRMGASDNIQQGRSTFLEELSEASQILHTCTARSLVIIDELGRGTSTHDGVAIAYATLHHLLAEKRCMVLFVTHYPKIATDIRKEFPGSVSSYHVSYLTTSKSGDDDSGDITTYTNYSAESEDITYLYKVVPGISARSFGFKVAQLAQLPTSCIKRGMEMAGKLEKLVQIRVMENQVAVRLSSDEEPLLLGPPICEAATSCVAYLNLKDLERFLRSLKWALGDDDQTSSYESLKAARRLAVELTTRLEPKDLPSVLL